MSLSAWTRWSGPAGPVLVVVRLGLGAALGLAVRAGFRGLAVLRLVDPALAGGRGVDRLLTHDVHRASVRLLVQRLGGVPRRRCGLAAVVPGLAVAVAAAVPRAVHLRGCVGTGFRACGRRLARAVRLGRRVGAGL